MGLLRPPDASGALTMTTIIKVLTFSSEGGSPPKEGRPACRQAGASGGQFSIINFQIIFPSKKDSPSEDNFRIFKHLISCYCESRPFVDIIPKHRDDVLILLIINKRAGRSNPKNEFFRRRRILLRRRISNYEF